MKRISFVVLSFVLLVVPTVSAFALAPRQAPQPPVDFNAFLVALGAAFVSLTFLPGAIAALLGILLKLVPGFTDASANVVSFVLNVAFYVAAGVLVYLGKADILVGVNTSLGGIAQLLSNILVILGGFGMSFGMTGHYTKMFASHAANMVEARKMLKGK